MFCGVQAKMYVLCGVQAKMMCYVELRLRRFVIWSSG